MENNKKQTAVEWLGKELESYGDPQFCKIEWEQLDSLIQQAKEMEKQQKKDTKTMEKLIESNRKFDEKNNNSIKYNPNDRSEDNPNVTNFFI
jgi:hypothetical protein